VHSAKQIFLQRKASLSAPPSTLQLSDFGRIDIRLHSWIQVIRHEVSRQANGRHFNIAKLLASFFFLPLNSNVKRSRCLHDLSVQYRLYLHCISYRLSTSSEVNCALHLDHSWELDSGLAELWLAFLFPCLS
jgi:hypothetical protein